MKRPNSRTWWISIKFQIQPVVPHQVYQAYQDKTRNETFTCENYLQMLIMNWTPFLPFLTLFHCALLFFTTIHHWANHCSWTILRRNNWEQQPELVGAVLDSMFPCENCHYKHHSLSNLDLKGKYFNVYSVTSIQAIEEIWAFFIPLTPHWNLEASTRKAPYHLTLNGDLSQYKSKQCAYSGYQLLFCLCWWSWSSELCVIFPTNFRNFTDSPWLILIFVMLCFHWLSGWFVTIA